MEFTCIYQTLLALRDLLLRVNSYWKSSRNYPPENADASALGHVIRFVRRAHKMVEATGIAIRP